MSFNTLLLDNALHIAGAIVEVCMVAAILYTRYWRTAALVSAVQLLEAAEYAACLIWPTCPMWYGTHAANILLDLCCLWTRSPLVFVMVAAHSFLKLYGYSGTNTFTELPLDSVFYADRILNLAIGVAITYDCFRSNYEYGDSNERTVAAPAEGCR